MLVAAIAAPAPQKPRASPPAADACEDDERDGAAAPPDDPIPRAARLMAAQHLADQEAQLLLDRMRDTFDQAQAERSELMREANVLRDMAMEQQKRDDEILKKWIALI